MAPPAGAGAASRDMTLPSVLNRDGGVSETQQRYGVGAPEHKDAVIESWAAQCQAELTLARREEAAWSRAIGLVKATFPEFSGPVGGMFDAEIRTAGPVFNF